MSSAGGGGGGGGGAAGGGGGGGSSSWATCITHAQSPPSTYARQGLANRPLEVAPLGGDGGEGAARGSEGGAGALGTDGTSARTMNSVLSQLALYRRQKVVPTLGMPDQFLPASRCLFSAVMSSGS